MKVLFISTTCSQAKYKDVFNSRTIRIIDPMQNFLYHIMLGVKSNYVDVTSISILPVSSNCYEKVIINRERDSENNINFIYPGFLNNKLLRIPTVYFTIFAELLIFLYKNRDTIIITDPLNPYISNVTRIASTIFNNKCIGIITDLPMYSSEMKERKESFIRKYLRKLYERFSKYEAGRFDGYIFLTESLKDDINISNKPYVIIEGCISSKSITAGTHQKLNNNDKFIILYAGGVYEKYGLNSLVEAFIEANLVNAELHIYGEGTYVNRLKEVIKFNQRIKYFGCVLNTELPYIESQANLLVNPRPTNENFTKYSFPSKTLEYMASGTPVLSTRLEGIPKEYDDYIFWIDDETIHGIAKTLIKISNLDTEYLRNYGIKAQKFILENKSSNKQGSKIVKLINTLKL